MLSKRLLNLCNGEGGKDEEQGGGEAHFLGRSERFVGLWNKVEYILDEISF